MDFSENLRSKAQRDPRRVVLPEGGDVVILKAARAALDERVAYPVLLGKEAEILAASEQAGVDLAGIEVLDPLSSPLLKAFVDDYARLRSFPEAAAQKILKKPLFFGAMMVRAGEADALVAGIAHPTEEVIMACDLIIGLRPGISCPSSFFLMDIPGFVGEGFEAEEGGLLIFADPAVNPDPSPEQLADIAIETARSAAELLGWEPRVAMLSFSTRGSAEHPRVEKVVQALRLAQERCPEILIDGEFQVDAAIVPEVARKKVKGESPVAGRANILIFPDLDAGNIGYKLVQRLVGAQAYGPVLQGFARPVCDLSRGASVEDVLGTIALVVVRAQAQ